MQQMAQILKQANEALNYTYAKQLWHALNNLKQSYSMLKQSQMAT